MSDSQDLAFEYVLGTLRGRERDEFQKQMISDPAVAKDVLLWEESLIDLHDIQSPLSAKNTTWESIDNRINGVASRKVGRFRRSLTQSWLGASVVALSCIVLLLFWTNEGRDPAYIAVLTNSSGKAQVTALTDNLGERLSLRWQEPIALEDDRSVQLWAQSRRDGEIRSLVVLEQGSDSQVQLSEAQWRLVKDADYLLLTIEEQGGSAIDEPSDILLAKGLCIRLESPHEKKSG